MSEAYSRDEILRAMFDCAEEGMYLVTPRGDFIAANAAYAALFGYPSSTELSAKVANVWKDLYLEPRIHFEMTAFTKNDAFTKVVEVRARRRDGTEFTIRENLSAVRDANGAIQYVKASVEEVRDGQGERIGWRTSDPHLSAMIERAERDTGVLLEIIDELCDAHKTLEATFVAVVRELVDALDSRRWWTRGRSQRVTTSVMKIADTLGMHEDEKVILQLGTLLHDIGQAVFLGALIDKPAHLTLDEVKLVRQHPVQGASILLNADELSDAALMIRHHHERMDGTGYPDGLQGEEIPLGARIIHVATAYESITADRPYRPARDRSSALREIKRHAASQFDPHIVEAALTVL